MKILKEISEEIYEKDSEKIITSMDVIGDIAIVKIPEEILDERRYKLAKEILSRLKNIKVVLRQRTPVEGLLRIRRFEYLAGERRTVTFYKEYGVVSKVDVEKTYFSPRLSKERKRISDLVEDGEVIINMFAGVGPYSLLIAKRHEKVLIHSIDINPYAIEFHLTNNILNKVEEKIVTYRGDAGYIITKYLTGSADRVLMPLPGLAIKYIPSALKALKKEGVIHAYLHIPYAKKEMEAVEKAEEIVKKEISRFNYKISSVEGLRVREIGPRVLQVCVDVYVKKLFSYS